MNRVDLSTAERFTRRRGASRSATQGALQRALKRVAPLWPLENFAAVNPFLGFVDEPFAAASRRLAAACDAPLLMPRAFYGEAIARGRISSADLAAVAGTVPGLQVEALIAHAATTRQRPAPFPTCAVVAAAISGDDWGLWVTNRLSHWASGYFDAGQAAWPSPFQDLPPYRAWCEEARLDCSDVPLGLSAWEAVLDSLPTSPEDLCEQALQQLAVPEEQLDLYLHRLLMSFGGWVAYARHQSWRDELAGREPRWVLDLLAVRLVWELVLMRSFATDGLELAWRRALSDAARRFSPAPSEEHEQRMDMLLQEAYERGWEREMRRQFAPGREPVASARPALQAVFCIDVRSEVLRRAMEAADASIETLGFAGFFGLPIEYIPLAGDGGAAHCPVLQEPTLSVRESAPTQSLPMINRLSRRIRLRRGLARGWRSFRSAAVSCFVFVESCGLAYAFKLFADSLGLSRPVPHPAHRGLPPRLARQLGPQLADSDASGVAIGLENQVAFAESMLRGMSLTRDFARLVVLAGHGSATSNNAHGTALDCGACAGQTGEASARTAAAILNNPEVKAALRGRGLAIPHDTWFLAALHVTTTDEVQLFDEQRLPDSHRPDLQRLRRCLASAGAGARAERAALLSLPRGAGLARRLRRRSRDWSEVRPEWGLTGCAGFIAAPRSLSRGLDLAGRAFLHSYNWRDDPQFTTLELIIAGPVVLASWISLQYYGSAVARDVFGAGDKTLHNVVGTSIGVFEGNAGDLRVGLPWQSVHDGERLRHEPLRLSVWIAAPTAAISDILQRQRAVRELADNGWLKLLALDDRGAPVARYLGDLRWDDVPVDGDRGAVP